MGDFFYICGMAQINDLVGVKPSIHSAIEEYARIIVPKPIESLTVSYMGSGGWRIDVGVNESVYDYLNKRRIKTAYYVIRFICGIIFYHYFFKLPFLKQRMKF